MVIIYTCIYKICKLHMCGSAMVKVWIILECATGTLYLYDLSNIASKIILNKSASQKSILVTVAFLVVFFFFRKNYLLLSCSTSVRPSVRPSVCPSVEIISFRGNSLPNRPIELKIGLNVREGVVHVRKA